jgi:CheY-like chemotaxis protein
MPKILVVDDDPMLRDAYELLLSSSGHSVQTAFDGEDALIQYERYLPDLILLDMLMPNLDGLGVLQKLNLSERGKAVKVIIFSNLSTSEKIDQALALGAERHITKSQMTPQQLLAEIDKLLDPDLGA